MLADGGKFADGEMDEETRTMHVMELTKLVSHPRIDFADIPTPIEE